MTVVSLPGIIVAVGDGFAVAVRVAAMVEKRCRSSNFRSCCRDSWRLFSVQAIVAECVVWLLPSVVETSSPFLPCGIVRVVKVSPFADVITRGRLLLS